MSEEREQEEVAINPSRVQAPERLAHAEGRGSEEEGMEIDSVSQPENAADAEWRFGADGVEAGRACAAEEQMCT